eukprot:s2822_g2.t1
MVSAVMTMDRVSPVGKMAGDLPMVCASEPVEEQRRTATGLTATSVSSTATPHPRRFSEERAKARHTGALCASEYRHVLQSCLHPRD